MKVDEKEKNELIQLLVQAYKNQVAFQNKGDIQNANRTTNRIVGVLTTLEILNIKDEILLEVMKINGTPIK